MFLTVANFNFWPSYSIPLQKASPSSQDKTFVVLKYVTQLTPNPVTISTTSSFEAIKVAGASCVSYFKTTATGLNWDQAKYFCLSKGLGLATTRDFYENQLLGVNYPNSWLGGRRKSEDKSLPEHSIFVWHTLSGYDEMRCESWNAFEPNDWSGQESCVTVNNKMKWNDFNCDSKSGAPVICERRYCNPISTPCDDPNP